MQGMKKIVLLNPKGGSGKTTVITNLAVSLARDGKRVCLLDLDPQGSSLAWLRKRPEGQAPIYGINGAHLNQHVTRSWQFHQYPDAEILLVDTPAGVARERIVDLLRDAQGLLMPILPSAIDIEVAPRTIGDLLLMNYPRERIGIVGNRVRSGTRSLDQLRKFLDQLGIPLITFVKDTQLYVQAGAQGLGLVEFPPWLTTSEGEVWHRIREWTAGLPALP
jgi:chromosome partitioning protein